MKDWKNYAIFLLALWCIWLTWRTTPSVVWSANYEQEYGNETPIYWWWGRNFHRDDKPSASVSTNGWILRKSRLHKGSRIISKETLKETAEFLRKVRQGNPDPRQTDAKEQRQDD